MRRELSNQRLKEVSVGRGGGGARRMDLRTGSNEGQSVRAQSGRGGGRARLGAMMSITIGDVVRACGGERCAPVVDEGREGK
jgi:hypothetical protein